MTLQLPRMMKLLFAGYVVLTCTMSASLSAQSRRFDVSNTKTQFLDIVAPIITEGELQIYKNLPDADAKRYFQEIFWYKRDPEPRTTENTFRREFFDRRQIAVE